MRPVNGVWSRRIAPYGATMKGFEWTHVSTDRYLVIGKDVRGKRFRQMHSNPYQALCINMCDGRVYLLRDNRRILVKRVQP
jgi:hypothetical protein